MAYDYHGKWEGKTGHNAPLYSHPDETEDDRLLNINASWTHLSYRGAWPEKTVLGVALYGRSFLLANASDSSMGAETLERSFSGSYTSEEGFMGYNEICMKQLYRGYGEPWNVEWSDPYAVPFMHQDTKWIGYDDRLSIALKTNYAVQNGMAGVMVWTIETDDFRGDCGHGPFPLLQTVNRVLSMAECGNADVFNDRVHTGPTWKTYHKRPGNNCGSGRSRDYHYNDRNRIKPTGESTAAPVYPSIWSGFTFLIGIVVLHYMCRGRHR
jgi:GH18 family chitinase